MTKPYCLITFFLVFLLLISVGCDDNSAVSLRYEAEKKLHQAESALKKTNIKPELVSSATMDQVEKLYANATDFSIAALDSIDQTKNPVEYRELQHLAFQSTNRTAQMLYHRRYYSKAITILERLLAVTNLQPLQKLATQINLGRFMQASGDWGSALAEYKSVIKEYYPPIDVNGDVLKTLFNLPIHIYRVEKLTGDSSTAADKLNWALNYYDELATSFPKTKLEVASHRNLAHLYDQTKRWQKEIDQLSMLLKTDTSSNISARVKIAELYGTKLKQYSRSLNLYGKLIDELKNSDSLLYSHNAIPLIQYKIAAVRMEQGKYAEARKIIYNIKDKYRRYFNSSPMAQYLVARSFELEGKWNRAEAEYNFLIENYRGSDEAMSSFLYIAKYLEKNGRAKEAERWYTDAEKYYQEVAATGSGTVVEARALAYQSELFSEQENWAKAAQQLIHIFERFPKTDPGHQALLRASGIYKHKLSDTTTADSLIEVFRTSIAEITDTQEK
ncbi:MAG: tetratricopeptide repeat protein [candidate division Zixibacteria bacterium]|nr:tetratricopeptide repeat protein [candidate division Zixibacteria bacterium]